MPDDINPLDLELALQASVNAALKDPERTPPFEDFSKLVRRSNHPLALRFDYDRNLESKIDEFEEETEAEVNAVIGRANQMRVLYPAAEQMVEDLGADAVSDMIRNEIRSSKPYHMKIDDILKNISVDIEDERLTPDRKVTQLVQILARAAHRFRGNRAIIDVVANAVVAKFLTNGGVSLDAGRYRYILPSLITENRFSPVLEPVHFVNGVLQKTFVESRPTNLLQTEFQTFEFKRLVANPSLLVDYLAAAPELLQELRVLVDSIDVYSAKNIDRAKRLEGADIKLLLPSAPALAKFERFGRAMKETGGKASSYLATIGLMGKGATLPQMLQALEERQAGSKTPSGQINVETLESEYLLLYPSVANRSQIYQQLKTGDPERLKAATKFTGSLQKDAAKLKTMWHEIVDQSTREVAAMESLENVVEDTVRAINYVRSRVFSLLADGFTSSLLPYALEKNDFGLTKSSLQGDMQDVSSIGLSNSPEIIEEYTRPVGKALLKLTRDRAFTVNKLERYKSRSDGFVNIQSDDEPGLIPTGNILSFATLNPVFAKRYQRLFLQLTYPASPLGSGLEFPNVWAIVDRFANAVSDELKEVRKSHPNLPDYQSVDFRAVDKYLAKLQPNFANAVANTLVSSLASDSEIEAVGYEPTDVRIYPDAPINSIYDALFSEGTQRQDFERDLGGGLKMMAQRVRDYQMFAGLGRNSSVVVYLVDSNNAKTGLTRLLEIAPQTAGISRIKPAEGYKPLAEHIAAYIENDSGSPIKTTLEQVETYVNRAKRPTVVVPAAIPSVASDAEDVYDLSYFDESPVPTELVLDISDLMQDESQSTDISTRTLSKTPNDMIVNKAPALSYLVVDPDGLGDALGMTVLNPHTTITGQNLSGTIKYHPNSMSDIKAKK